MVKELTKRADWLTKNKIAIRQNVNEIQLAYEAITAIITKRKTNDRGFPEQFKQFIEIGSLSGGSVYIYSGMLEPYSKIVLVDLQDRKGCKNIYKVADKLREEGLDVHIICEKSQNLDTICEVDKKINRIFDTDHEGEYGLTLFHIDGCHQTASVLMDFWAYVHLLRKGSFCVFHDISNSQVKQAWSSIVRQFNGARKIVKVENGGKWGSEIGILEII